MAQAGVTEAVLEAVLAAFNDHDLDAIMAFLADDCSLDMPRGREPWGTRFEGKRAVREALATRFQGLPDVRYKKEWGYSALVEFGGKRILFGTGNDSAGFADNVRTLGIDLASLSHGVGDRR